MRAGSFSVFALSLAFLAVGLAGSDAAEAGRRCKKLRPTPARVCVKTCNQPQGTFVLRFKRGEPGFIYKVRLNDCVDFEVELGPNGTATFELNDLVDLHPRYVKVIVPAEPYPKEYVPKFKSCD